MAALRIRPIELTDEAQVRAAQQLMAVDAFKFALELAEGQDFAAYIRRLREVRCGVKLAPDRVPAAMLVADVWPDPDS